MKRVWWLILNEFGLIPNPNRNHWNIEENPSANILFWLTFLSLIVFVISTIINQPIIQVHN